MRDASTQLATIAKVNDGAGWVIVILEFFRRKPGENDRVLLATEKRHFETPEAATLYAQGALNNVVFNDVAADGCLVKTRLGAVIYELARNTVQR
jgi:hypothetical protein